MEIQMIKQDKGKYYQFSVAFPDTTNIATFKEQFCKQNDINSKEFNNAMLSGLALFFSGQALKKSKPNAIDYLKTLGTPEKQLEFLKLSSSEQESLVVEFAQNTRIVRTKASRVSEGEAKELQALWRMRKEQLADSMK
jgi:hypothetical protein